MKRQVTALEMKKLDRIAQEKYGILPIILMENAGRKAAYEILKRFEKGRGAVFCGKGNNAGDGFVAARYLKQNGVTTDIFIIGETARIKSGASLINLKILKKMDFKIKKIATVKSIDNLRKKFRYDFIVDAIFGIGFKGALPSDIACVVNFLNSTKKPIYALDVPSGLDATSGVTHGECIKAYKTITFGFAKTGFSKKTAKPYIGKVVVKDIGFPKNI